MLNRKGMLELRRKIGREGQWVPCSDPLVLVIGLCNGPNNFWQWPVFLWYHILQKWHATSRIWPPWKLAAEKNTGKIFQNLPIWSRCIQWGPHHIDLWQDCSLCELTFVLVAPWRRINWLHLLLSRTLVDSIAILPKSLSSIVSGVAFTMVEGYVFALNGNTW